MYSRPIDGSRQRIKLPENYSGTAVEECPSYENAEAEVHSAPPGVEEVPCDCGAREKEPVLGRARQLFSRLPFHMPRFEGEDLLILGVCALLFFSKDGDKECALLLLILLFIG